MIKFLVVRHGQSVANEKEIFAGVSNVELTNIGIQQAELACNYLLDNFTIDAVYASELQRARNTVKKISDTLNIPLGTLPCFNEVNGGVWEGVNFHEIYKIYTQDFTCWLTDIVNTRCTGGESFKEASSRVYNGLVELAKKPENDAKTIVIGAHACIIRALLYKVMNLTDEECNKMGWVPNASTTTIIYDNGKFEVTELGYNGYLGDLKTQLPKHV